MAEVIKLTDKYITTNSIYDENRGTTQAYLNTPYMCNVCYNLNGGDATFKETEIKFNTVISDVGGCYSTSTGRFTCPVNGIYMVSYGCYSNNGEINTNNRPAIYVDGYMNIMTNVVPFNLVDILHCTKGQTISAGVCLGSISFFAYYGHNWFQVSLIKQL